jgi:outer membrane receptor protein involved in Fe transport
VNLVPKKPEDKFTGYVTAGGGNFSNKEIEGAVNVPVLEDRIFLRAAGIYRQRNGYVKNSLGGSLNGINTAGGRISFELLPFYNHKLNLSGDYIRNDQPGLALINPWVAGSEEGNGIFDYSASLDGTGDHGFKQEFMNASLVYRIFRNENNFLTSVTSYRKSDVSDLSDADGTELPALGMEDKRDADIFYQELRYNFSRKSRTNGSFGINYQRAVNDNSNQITSDDRMLMEIIKHPGNFLMPEDNRFPVNPQPLDYDPADDIILTGSHSENYSLERKARCLQAYLHFTHQLTGRVFFTGGVRAAYQMMQLAHEAAFIEGASSFLGNYAGSFPNLIYQPSEVQVVNNNEFIITGQAGLKYRLNEKFNFFINASHGRKPELHQFTWDSNRQSFEGEKINGLEAGLKLSLAGRIFWNATGFYRMHENVQAVVWRATEGDGLLNGEGKAFSYGAETGVKAALIKGLELFGNYSWFFSQFDSTDISGQDYVYAGNRFAYAPEHSYSAGLIAKAGISEFANLIVTPWYVRKSQFWFTENNSPGLSQSGYGVLNLSAALELVEIKLTLSLYGHNILDQNYLTGAGHRGGLFGIPVVQPGNPRMFGAKLKWEF